MSFPRKQRRGETKLPHADQLVATLESAITSEGSAELAVLYLLSRYNFDINDLHCLLQGLYLSFKVKYRDIAARVDLDNTLAGNDMPQFFIHRARIPTRLFKDIVSDLEVIMNQYGEPVNHKNEEARSRFLAPLFNRTVALLKLAITNTPESTIHGRLTTKGRIEYHFLVFGGVSILVIEVKYALGVAEERLDAIAQIIAECDACDYSNELLRFSSFPIYAILSDGASFEFFAFNGSPDPPTFSRGVFKGTVSKQLEMLTIANYTSALEKDFIFSL
ncbi:hypothetical protein APHAL10511_000626 [Amanita phalloides]|nr:hypothetical protein APHAL10511_000626 [Amanita phalloides]